MRYLVVAAVSLLALGAVAPAQAAYPGRNGEVSYGYQFRDEPEDGSEIAFRQFIASSLPGGSGPGHRLAGCEGSGDCQRSAYDQPSYSSDGKLIVFKLDQRLARVRWNGEDVTPLPPLTADDSQPAWGPTGQIVFTGRATASGAPDLYVVNANGTGLRRLTSAGGESPEWSSRNRIAFVRGGNVFTVRPDGSGLRQVTRRGGTAPDWSPHASKIAFIRNRRIHMVGLADGRVSKVTVRRGIGDADDVAWSPDGRQFAYHSFESGISAVRTDGTDFRDVSPGGSGATYSFDSLAPDWQPLPR